MQIRSLVRAATAAAIFGLVAPTAARAQTIIKDNSSPVVVSGYTSYQTDFNEVGGMQVSWVLSSGGSSAFWGDISAASGVAGRWGIWTSDFKLWGDGSTDTYDSNVWNLWAMNLVSFTMEGLLGNSSFDLSSPTPGTDGTSDGKTFNWSGSGPGSRVTYSNPIAVSPNAFVGDEYGTLKVEFGSDGCPSGWSEHNGQCKRFNWQTWQYDYQPLAWQASLFGTSSKCRNDKDPTSKKTSNPGKYDNTYCWEQFTQDMDNLANDPGTPQDVVPEPASMTLLATGLVGMMAAARRRRNKK